MPLFYREDPLKGFNFGVDESFEYSDGWPDTLPDNIINPNLDFSLSETSILDSFENIDGWPEVP